MPIKNDLLLEIQTALGAAVNPSLLVRSGCYFVGMFEGRGKRLIYSWPLSQISGVGAHNLLYNYIVLG